jgi:hypothetical protein
MELGAWSRETGKGKQENGRGREVVKWRKI